MNIDVCPFLGVLRKVRPIIMLPFPNSQILSLLEYINPEVGKFPGTHFYFDEGHRQKFAFKPARLFAVSFLIGRDDDAALSQSCHFDGMEGIIEEIFANVEFIVVLHGVLFGLPRHVGHDVEDTARHLCQFIPSPPPATLRQ